MNNHIIIYQRKR